MHTLVPECNTANVLATVHVPRSKAEAELLRRRVLTPSLQHCLLEVKRTC